MHQGFIDDHKIKTHTTSAFIVRCDDAIRRSIFHKDAFTAIYVRDSMYLFGDAWTAL